MADKYLNKYRIKSARWQNWDYSAEGLYFITVNTVHHNCLLGNIKNNEMALSDYGKIVAAEWDKSFEIRKELFCDSFVIMPNHLHAILRIEHQNTDNGTMGNDEVGLVDEVYHFDDADHIRYMNTIRDAHKTIEIHGVRPVGGANMTYNVHHARNTGVAYRPPKSISSFIAGFKSSVTTKINDSSIKKRPSIWQTRFHDHVIRDHKEHRYIENYINTNIENWNEEQFYID